MTHRYTIAATPTEYRGVRFRSKLEACWAHLFDQIGMPWEYEPRLEIAGWLPDFRLWGRFLVEVKPVAPSGFGMAFEEFDLFKKAVRTNWTILLGDGPGGNFGALTVDMGEQCQSACTFFYDPAHPYLMRSVFGDGGSDPQAGALTQHWSRAKSAFGIVTPVARPSWRGAPGSQAWRRSMK